MSDKAPKERGILFTAQNVRAILDGQKTQTRRTMGLDHINEAWDRTNIDRVDLRKGVWHFWSGREGSSSFPIYTARCPYGVVGDRLWVKETFYCDSFEFPNIPESDRNDREWCEQMLYYRADGEDLCTQIPECDRTETKGCWNPSIFMPRWASRITLEITAVCLERLQSISEADAKAEGVDAAHAWAQGARDFKTGFILLWESINRKKHAWAINPWVWAITFKVL